ncbi:hypothetical protein FT663_03162 [Candidozyma haemuli var. vulneris]|nr:hypothetical protein FT662_05344 [[Candida] haemuloni var. vulneris]KAF3990497.1 hypothetical protein FT663_03162 [[Candida] haemuloni var. vulneris]
MTRPETLQGIYVTLQEDGDQESLCNSLDVLRHMIQASEDSERGSRLGVRGTDVIWQILKTKPILKNNATDTLKFRVYRGVVLYLRSVSSYSILECSTILQCLLSFWKCFNSELTGDLEYWKWKTLVSYAELLSNLSVSASAIHELDGCHLGDFFDLCAQSSTWRMREFNNPFIRFFQNWIKQSDAPQVFLSLDNNSLLDDMALEVGRLAVADQFSVEDELLLQAFSQLLIDQAFGTFLQNYHSTRSSEQFTVLLNACRLLITADVLDMSSHWIACLNWLIPALGVLTMKTTIVLSESTDKNDINYANRQTIAVLDAVSHILQDLDLSHFDGKLQIVGYLGELLKVTHHKAATKTLGKRSKEGTPLPKYPMVKSLVIEILGRLCFDDPEVQRIIREEYILEYILSSCIIDDYNPYIKERAIICIKYALAGNAANQKFVAELEAQQVVDESVLNQAGVEAYVENGSVKFRKYA